MSILFNELQDVVETVGIHFEQGSTYRYYRSIARATIRIVESSHVTTMVQNAREKRRQLWELDGPYCQICGRTFESFWDKDLTLDHIHPQFLGGGHELSNLRLACGRCNLDYAKQFQSLIDLKNELVEKERLRPGSKPDEKYVLIVSPTSKEATFLVPKKAKTFIRDLVRRMPLTDPCAAAATHSTSSTAPPPSSFALSPNVNHAANYPGGGIIRPRDAPFSFPPAHRASGGSTCCKARPSPFFPAPSVMRYEPMDLSN
jgi:HNH endonuclease